MNGRDRKAAVAAYKDRKVVAGIYAVRCVPTGQQWVGGAPDLSTVRNRIWFGLRLGSDPHPSLQAGHGGRTGPTASYSRNSNASATRNLPMSAN